MSIDIAYLSSSPELIGFVNAYYSEDNNSNWQKIEFKKTETTSKQEGWSTATLVAKDLGVKGNLYLKVVIYPIAYYSGADAIENCYGIGISSINVNGATVDNNEEKEDNKIVWALAIIGAIAAVAGITFAVYKYLTPDYMDDFDEDFDDGFDDDFFDEEDDTDVKEEDIEEVE